MSPTKRKSEVTGNKTRVLVVDDHPLIREGITHLINKQEDLEVCGEAASEVEAIQAAVRLSPDLAIVDLALEESSGLELIKNFKARFPKMAILVVSMQDESFHAERVLRAGASGYVMKGRSLQSVLTAIRTVVKGDVYLSDAVASKVMARLVGSGRAESESPLMALSDRELQVFQLIGEGMGVAEIAERLHLSTKTIETYRSHLKDKLKLDDARALRQYAIEHGRNLP